MHYCGGLVRFLGWFGDTGSVHNNNKQVSNLMFGISETTETHRHTLANYNAAHEEEKKGVLVSDNMIATGCEKQEEERK